MDEVVGVVLERGETARLHAQCKILQRMYVDNWHVWLSYSNAGEVVVVQGVENCLEGLQ